MDKIKEIEKISKPLVEYLKKNYNPHTSIIIDENYIRVVSDEVSIPLKSKKIEKDI